jgi:phage terminase large subunit-like protein
MATVVRKVMKLHSVQAIFSHSSALWRGFIGGRGSGKSYAGAYDLIRRAKRGRTYLVCAPTYSMLNDSTLRSFLLVARDFGVIDPEHLRKSPPPQMTLSTGAEILFRSADDPERLRGPNFSGAWLDEASQMSKDVFDIVIASLREGGETGWLSATMTPHGLSHWTYEKWGKAQADTAIFHARTRDNPFLPADFAHKVSLQYTGLRAQQELDGLFVAIEGAEWPDSYFSEDLWFRDMPTEGIVASAMALDPSKGKDASKHKEGREPDYSAFVIGFVDRSGVVWLDADLDNSRDTTRIVLDGIGLYRLHRPLAVVIEINTFQELFAGEFLRVARETNTPHLPLYGINNFDHKEVRIRTIGPFLAKRELRFRDTPGCRKLVQQLRDFPAGDYVDGPDALEMCLKMLLFLLTGRAEGAQPKLLKA